MDRPDDDDDVGGYRWSKSPAFECVQELPLPLPPLKLFWGRSHRSLPRWRGNAPPVWKTSPSRKSNKTTKPNQIKQKEGRKVWPGVVKMGRKKNTTEKPKKKDRIERKVVKSQWTCLFISETKNKTKKNFFFHVRFLPFGWVPSCFFFYHPGQKFCVTSLPLHPPPFRLFSKRGRGKYYVEQNRYLLTNPSPREREK
jgi:hypothetical protein